MFICPSISEIRFYEYFKIKGEKEHKNRYEIAVLDGRSGPVAKSLQLHTVPN